MECPYCGTDSRVLDSRRSGEDVRRRRECLACKRRFTTYERLAPPEIRVKKRGQAAEDFDRKKILKVIERVSRNRPLAPDALADLGRGLEVELVDAGVHEIDSWRIAARLHDRLLAVDPVAAQRFASNYPLQPDGAPRFSEDAASPQLALPIRTPTPTPATPALDARPSRPARPTRASRPAARKR